MNHQQIHHNKQLIKFGHDIGYRSKLLEHHLTSMSTSTCAIAKERQYREAVQLLSEITNICNELYHSGMDALKGDPLTPKSTEQDLIEIAMHIGKIANCNPHYTAGLSACIAQTGIGVGQLTIAELIELDNQHRKNFNYQAKKSPD